MTELSAWRSPARSVEEAVQSSPVKAIR